MAYYPKQTSPELNALVAQLNSILGANYFALRIDKDNGQTSSTGRSWLYFLQKTRLGVQDLGTDYNWLVTNENDGMYLKEMRLWLTGVIDGLKTYKQKLLTFINKEI